MRPGAPFLVYRDAEGHRRLLELPDQPARLTIGRRPTADVALPWDAEVSRLHAELVRLGAELVVQDDGLSHNGTFVNGERVRGRRRLRPGDAITVGTTVIAVCGFDASTAVGTRDAHAFSKAVDVTPAQARVLDALTRPLRAHPHAMPATNRAIAEELTLSIDTIKGTLSALFELHGLSALGQNEKRAVLAQRALSDGRCA